MWCPNPWECNLVALETSSGYEPPRLLWIHLCWHNHHHCHRLSFIVRRLQNVCMGRLKWQCIISAVVAWLTHKSAGFSSVFMRKPRFSVRFLLDSFWYCVGLKPIKTTLWTGKTPKCFLTYLLQNLTDSDNIWYILSWVNFVYRNGNIFHLTCTVSVHYLVKLGIRILQVNGSQTVNREIHTKFFCHMYLLQNEADSDKVWYIFFWFVDQGSCPFETT